MRYVEVDGLRLSKVGLGTWQFGTESGAARWQVLGALLEAMKTLSPARRADLTARIVAQSDDRAGQGPRGKLWPAPLTTRAPWPLTGPMGALKLACFGKDKHPLLAIR